MPFWHYTAPVVLDLQRFEVMSGLGRRVFSHERVEHVLCDFLRLTKEDTFILPLALGGSSRRRTCLIKLVHELPAQMLLLVGTALPKHCCF